MLSCRLAGVCRISQAAVRRPISTASKLGSYKNVNDKLINPSVSDVLDANATSLMALEVFRASGIIFGKIFSEPATINYPFEKGPLSPRFRGE